jgi:ornithine--oxo-acid transaminase
MTFKIANLLEEHSNDKFDLHEQFLNNQMVRVLKTIGYDRHYMTKKAQNISTYSAALVYLRLGEITQL